jgi:hypothetical protein
LTLSLHSSLARQRVEQERRENGAVALAANALVGRRIEQLARLMIAEGRGLPFAAFRFRARDAFDRIVGHGVLVTEIFK